MNNPIKLSGENWFSVFTGCAAGASFKSSEKISEVIKTTRKRDFSKRTVRCLHHHHSSPDAFAIDVFDRRNAKLFFEWAVEMRLAHKCCTAECFDADLLLQVLLNIGDDRFKTGRYSRWPQPAVIALILDAVCFLAYRWSCLAALHFFPAYWW